MGQPVLHWQILAKHPDQIAQFYKSLFGWTVDAANGLGYRAVETHSQGVNGGIWPAPPEGNSMVSLYVEVDDVARHVKRATELGAKLIVPPQKLPDGDEMAVILDLEGIPFGLMRRSSTQRPKAK